MLTAKSLAKDNRAKIHPGPAVCVKPFLALFLAALAFSLVVAPCAAQSVNKSEAKLRVMSYNAY